MADATQSNHGTIVAETRHAKRLSRAELAQKLGVDVSTLSRIETGQRPVSRKLRPQLCSVLGLDPGVFAPAPVTPGGSPEQSRPLLSPWEDGDKWKTANYCESEATRIISSALSEPVAKDLNRFLPAVIKYVRDAWARAHERKHGEPNPYIARRGPNHCLAMMRILFQRFTRVLRGLAPAELRILAAAMWLHDIGLTLDEASTHSRGGLDSYHEWSESHVWENYYSFGLCDPEEARVVGTLCRFHRNTDHLPDLKISGAGGGLSVDEQKALIALLRLGNLMDVHYNRVRDTELHPKMPPPIDFQSELLRNLFVTQLYEDGHFLRAEVRYDPDWGPSRVSPLMSTVERDLRTDLSRIKDVLISNLPHWVLLWTKVVGGPHPDPGTADKLFDATRFLGTSRSPNAAKVLDDLVEYLKKDLSSARDPGRMCETAKSDIDDVVQLCSQQAQLLNLQERARKVKDADELRAIVKDFETEKRKAYEDIAKAARGEFKVGDWFILFGFSAAVLEALKALGEDVQASSRVFVLECRNKTLYGPENSVEYCDGVQYAIRVRQLGYRRVYLASDSSAAYILAATKREPTEWEPYFKRPKGNRVHVLLGADGIDKDDAAAWSTVGCLPLALAAKEHDAKVYVLAEPNKVRPGLKWPRPRETTEWLTSEPAINRDLKQTGIEMIHPLNERLPSKLVTWFPPLDECLEGERRAANGKARRRKP
jgi:translation initiation factor 2B subunit (eIF-2B alpha/beta/delta family)/transcriptional regulator with XRE-family HTH domain